MIIMHIARSLDNKKNADGAVLFVDDNKGRKYHQNTIGAVVHPVCIFNKQCQISGKKPASGQK